MKIHQLTMTAFGAFAALALMRCAGNAAMDANTNVTGSVSTFSGRIIDAPIKGLEYRTATQSGVTDADGAYRYAAGERVTFFIGKTVLGTADAGTYVTPENFSANGLSDQSVKNILRFLQTLDADGSHGNGIEITQTVRDLLVATSINFNQTATAFDNDIIVKAAIQVSRGAATPLISETSALASFLAYRFSGSFSDNYGGKHFLTAAAWQLKDSWTNQTDSIVKINGIARYFIIQKSAADAFNASKFQKVVYIPTNDGSFYTCTLSPFDNADAATAEAITDSSVKTNPGVTGCGSFAWTKMTPVAMPLTGNWKDPYSGKHTVTLSTWTVDFGAPASDAIIRYNAINDYIVIQKPANDAFNPSKFQKIVITQANGSWYFCTLSPFDSATADAAAAITDSTNKTSPATGGCSGFSWTQLIP